MHDTRPEHVTALYHWVNYSKPHRLCNEKFFLVVVVGFFFPKLTFCGGVLRQLKVWYLIPCHGLTQRPVHPSFGRAFSKLDGWKILKPSLWTGIFKGIFSVDDSKYIHICYKTFCSTVKFNKNLYCFQNVCIFEPLTL